MTAFRTSDPSGSIAETQARLEQACKDRGFHNVSSTFDKERREGRHICQDCGQTTMFSMSIAK